MCAAPGAYAASWISLVPADHVADSYYVGNYRYVLFDFERIPLIKHMQGAYVGQAMGSVGLTPNPDLSPKFFFTCYPLGVANTGGPPLSSGASGGIAIDLVDFKPNAALTISGNFKLQFDVGYWNAGVNLSEGFKITYDYAFTGYRADGTYVGSIIRSRDVVEGILQDVPGDSFTYELPVDLNLDLSDFPSDIRYVVPWCQLVFEITDDEPDLTIGFLHLSFENFTMLTRTDMLLQESMTMQEINDKLDQIIDQPQNEKDEALNEGADLADQLTGALPNESQGFMNAIQSLANAMSYDGTDAKLMFPAISLPEIPGVMKGYKLSDEMEVDFGFWVQKMPAAVMTLVQNILTIALIVFCFKELYGLISYAMTLKGDSE